MSYKGLKSQTCIEKTKTKPMNQQKKKKSQSKQTTKQSKTQTYFILLSL